jgi:DNA helicase-2/ATP-dependent DNA helicase PcrA
MKPLGKRPAREEGNEIPETPVSDDPVSGLTLGMRVKHERFGIGKVMALEGVFPNVKASIQFDVQGLKTLLLKFARLEKLD